MTTTQIRPPASRHPLPAWRVSVIRDGERRPWTPPPVEPKPAAREYCAIDYGENPVFAPPGTQPRRGSPALDERAAASQRRSLRREGAFRHKSPVTLR